MLNQTFIKERLESIQMYCRHLDEIVKAPATELKKDFTRYYALERVFQLIVDEMVDVNSHIIRHGDFRTPDDFQSTFMIMAENGILPEDFAKRIAPSVGLRNRLVHRYEEIDKDLVVKMILKEKDDFKEYVKLIHDFLKK